MIELNYRDIIITLIVILTAMLLYRFSLPSYVLYVLLLVYFILTFAVKMDSRLPIAGALLLLIMTPFFLIRNVENYANYLATLAYFLLVIGVIKQFVEYLKNN
jgi:hypothetical protein